MSCAHTVLACVVGACHAVACGARSGLDVVPDHTHGVGDSGTTHVGPSHDAASDAEETPASIVVSAGHSHSCAIDPERHLWCWGLNQGGQLGDGTQTTRPRPTRVASDLTWTAISAGGWDGVTCAIATDRSLYCWGSNFRAQLGTGDPSDRSAPTRIGSARWLAVQLGYSHACGVQEDHTLWCWGEHSMGQLGVGPLDGDRSRVPLLVGQDRDWSVVACGYDYTCAVKDSGSLWCWGECRSGQTGITPCFFHDTPQRVGEGTDWTSVHGHFLHTCGITQGARLFCWGSNSDGQVGMGTVGAHAESPVEIAPGIAWGSVSAGGKHTCGIRIDATLDGWGDHSAGQLGVGTDAGTRVPVPAPVGHNTHWRQVSAGTEHTCAVQTNDTLWCWGANGSRQIGDGTTTSRSVPAQIRLADD